MRPDGTLNPASDALVQPLRARCGRRLDAPSRRRARTRRTRMAPVPHRTVAGGAIQSASSRHDSPYGLAASSWELTTPRSKRGQSATEQTARVQLPGQADDFEVGAGTHSWSVPFEPPPPALPTPQWADHAPDGVSSSGRRDSPGQAWNDTNQRRISSGCNASRSAPNHRTADVTGRLTTHFASPPRGSITLVFEACCILRYRTCSDAAPTAPSRSCSPAPTALGADKRVTNFAGGNTSAKLTLPDPITGTPTAVLAVKGSGGDLGTLTASGLALLVARPGARTRATARRRACTRTTSWRAYAACRFGDGGAVPSIDTPLHAFVDAPPRRPPPSRLDDRARDRRRR